ncbi:hypothetical protein B0H19DRAFT_328343 [Mycena capillaripes]|nr:hypothetical protein B0H19DRAFT_328343 [Mycena capillaripes]
MHLPKHTWESTHHTAWDHVARSAPEVHDGPSWPAKVGIPDKSLPEPWTCNWGAWGPLPFGNSFTGGIPSGINRRFDIALMDETPLMFRSTESNNGTTVFRARNLKERRTGFYLYDEPFNNVYRFEHAVKNGSAEEFIETVDWNKMTYLGSLKGPPLLSSMEGRAFSVGSRKCLLRDLGKIQHTPWKSEPRILRDACEQHRAIIQTASHRCFFIPDTQLPEPWTCDWANWSGWDSRVPLFYDVARWYNLLPLNAIMFHEWITVFESSGVYYLYDLEYAKMYRFHGHFSTVEDFIDDGDWNKMERLEYSGACSDAGTSAHGRDRTETPVQSSGTGFRTASNEP